MGLLETVSISKEKDEIIQQEKLLELLQYIGTHSPFYQKLFTKHQAIINDIKTLADLAFLPVTTKEQ